MQSLILMLFRRRGHHWYSSVEITCVERASFLMLRFQVGKAKLRALFRASRWA